VTIIKLNTASFKEIIENNYVYADKTRLIHELLRPESEDAIFLSRPRRFGKSLLLNTIERLFKGPTDPQGCPKGLFESLWIGRNENDSYFTDIFHPVIHLSMSLPSSSPEFLLKSLTLILKRIGVSHDLDISETPPAVMLVDIVEALNRKYNKAVVLLIDEYEAPVTSNFNDKALAKANLGLLKDFYSPLKILQSQQLLRFVFLTGITRYALLWDSSELNHLKDITMSENYSTIYGFTHDEFDSCFSEYLSKTLKTFKRKGVLGASADTSDLRKAIFDRYDGYSWDGINRVLNPYSLLNSFKDGKLGNYWISLEPSAKFLYPLMSKNPLAFTSEKLRNLSETKINMIELGDSLSPISALFHTGYLTVDKITFVNGNEIYNFKAPNEEVGAEFREVFTNSANDYFGIDMSARNNAFIKAITAEDADKVTDMMSSLIQKLPAKLHNPNEKHYHSMFYSYFESMRNITVSPEPVGTKGIPDILLILENKFYIIIEIKYKDDKIAIENINETDYYVEEKIVKKAIKNPELEAEKLAIMAMKAIRSVHYADPYKAEAKRILKMGIGVFGKEKVKVLLENEDQSKLIIKTKLLEGEVILLNKYVETFSIKEANILKEKASKLKNTISFLNAEAEMLKRKDFGEQNNDVDKLAKEIENLKMDIENLKKLS
jgi:hypothetical protein